ncbi:MAG TPA: ATPase [Lachnospiraceae bacterium]|nr:ATPase [Lachnospiraceae bacterium]
MTLATEILVVVALILSIILPGLYFLLGERSRGRFRGALAVNCFLFFGILLISSVVLLTGSASVFAAEGAQAGSGLKEGLGYIAAALSTGISCLGGGIAVASAASAALGAISEDQSILGKSLIFVGLAEGVCLYGLIISFMIIGQLG